MFGRESTTMNSSTKWTVQATEVSNLKLSHGAVTVVVQPSLKSMELSKLLVSIQPEIAANTEMKMRMQDLVVMRMDGSWTTSRLELFQLTAARIGPTQLTNGRLKRPIQNLSTMVHRKKATIWKVAQLRLFALRLQHFC